MFILKDDKQTCEPNLSIEDCSDDFVHQEPAFCGTVPVVWQEPSATDGCGSVVQVQKTHEPGVNLTAGTTTITYTFTDVLLNQMTCEFDVSVATIRKYRINFQHAECASNNKKQ